MHNVHSEHSNRKKMFFLTGSAKKMPMTTGIIFGFCDQFERKFSDENGYNDYCNDYVLYIFIFTDRT